MCDEDFGPGPQDLGRRRFDRDLFSNSSGKEIVGQVSNDGLDGQHTWQGRTSLHLVFPV